MFANNHGDKLTNLKNVWLFKFLLIFSQIVANLPVQNEAFRLNITSIHQTTTPAATPTSTNNNSSSQLYPNHRMTNEANQNSSIDRQASDSILRPQLALQIYTHSPSDSQAPEAASNSNTVRAGYLQSSSKHREPINQDKQKNSRYNLMTSASNQQAHKKYLLSPSAKQADLWQYDTGHGNAGDAQGAGDSMNALPMINAIITLPTSSQPSKVARQQQQDDILQQNLTSSALNVERAITRLLDGQASGNIEFSMNMNGDEIVINPISKQGGSILASSLNNVVEASEPDDSSSSYVNRRFARFSRHHPGDDSADSDDQHQLNRALKRHISSELAGDEQSASEIDTIDGNESDASNDNNSPIEGEENDSSTSSSRSSKSYDNQAAAGPKSKFWSSVSNSESHVVKDDDLVDQQVVDESINHYQGRDKHNKRPPYPLDVDQTDQGEPNRGSMMNKQVKQSSGRQLKQVTNRRRQTAGSKRKAQFRDGREEADSHNNRQRNNDQSTVVIKGEDVKKFEQLLENLRSLSINNLASSSSSSNAGVRPIKKSAPKASRPLRDDNSNEIDQDDNKSAAADNDSDSAGEDNVHQKSRWNHHQVGSNRDSSSSSSLSAKGSVQPRSFDSNVDIECDRRRQRLRKTSSNNEPIRVPSMDSTPNIVDNDPITSSDGNDELNDESSQNIEQEENFEDDVPSRQGNMEASESDLSPRKSPMDTSTARVATETNPAGLPKSLFVRKTILQTYYDNHANGNNTSLEDSPTSSLSEIQQNNLRDTPDEQVNHQSGGYNLSSSRPQTSSRYQEVGAEDNLRSEGQLVSQSTPPPASSNGYIDYNSLDDREVYRGSESRKFKALAEAPTTRQQQQQHHHQQQRDKLRSLQQVFEKAILEGKRARASQA